MKWDLLLTPALVYDAMNCVALALIGVGVGLFNIGAALIVVGVLILALNIFAVMRK